MGRFNTAMLPINDKIIIADEHLRVSFVRSRGPGGQNVNKVNTRCQLTFDFRGCQVLDSAVKKRLALLAGRRLTDKGTLIIQSDRFRQQNRNRQQCLDRLRRLIQKALIPPKKRRPTKPTAASKRKRLEDKHRRGRQKSLRGKISLEE
ncbi:alternative ribosome rescue aminoacyl-tRNA hydrolase ArfB [Planctomycetota bacterium]